MYKLFFASLTIVWGLSIGCEVASQSAGNLQAATDNGPLISAQELKEILGQENLVVIDLGPEKEIYDEGHIKGSIYVDWVDDITDIDNPEHYKIAPKESFEALLRRIGVTKDSRIVIYDDMNSRVAMRMYWSLKYFGLSNLQLLNGGRGAWANAGNELVTDAPNVTPSEFKIETVNEELSVNLDYIADRLQNPKVCLIDGRPIEQYSGKEPGKVFHTGAIHQKRGHIPGAINIFWKDNFNEDGTFKSKEELEKLYEQVSGSEWVVTYCNEGLHAVPSWFVMSELLGKGNVRVYDDSMSQWANSEQPTVVTFKESSKAGGK